MFWQLFLILTIFHSIVSLKLHLSVEENKKPNSPVGNLVKLIKNLTKSNENSNFKTFQLELEKSNNYGQRNLISIDQKNGDIWIQSPIDREEICLQINKCEKGAFLDYVIIADSTVFELQIEVIDLNDNYPTFQPDEKTIKIPEGISKNTEYSLPVAKDKDSTKYGIVEYSLETISPITHVKYFELVNNSKNRYPYLRVIGDLDRELVRNYEFDLFAIDGGGNRGKCKIIVEIMDINDNTPQWIGLPYRKEISECTVENKILQLTAQDKDDQQTEGGKIMFKISDNSPNYEIIMRTFFITENMLYLNSGVLKSFGSNKVSIVVIATDGGGRTNETTVELEIKDCNDHSPEIQLLSNSLQVKENGNSKIVVAMITVTDKDQGINSEFSCNLNDTTYLSLESIYQQNRLNVNEQQKKIFKLITNTGVSFDREKMSRHTLEILCSDNGTPTMSSAEKLTIFIQDENDNPPIFDGKFKTFSISEDAKIGNEVGKIVATDIDTTPNNIVSYSIIGSEEIKQTFSVNNLGFIHLSKNIDRETKDRYEFDLLASDNGKPTLNDSCRIRIIVIDVNDNAPEINEKHNFKIVESYGHEQKHISIGKLNATDRDNGINGTFKFKIKSINHPFPALQISNDGRLTIFGLIDREKTDSIEALIEVIDNGIPHLTGTTTISIEVLDLNDNKPLFKFPTNHYNTYINISYDIQSGHVIGKVTAEDPDKDANGTISFTITGSEALKKHFTIHSDGTIILNQKLKDTKSNRLTVEARDQGSPVLTSTTNLFLNYLTKQSEPNEMTNDNNNDFKNSKNVNPRKKPNNGISSSMLLLGFLVVAIVLILIGIASIAIFLYCRSQGISRMNDHGGKHLPTNRDSSVVYQKGLVKHQIMKSDSLINNETLMKNDNYNQVGIPNSYPPNFTNLMVLKNNCCNPIDNSYQFGHPLLTDNYSAFHPKSNTPTVEKDQQEFATFNCDEPWTQSKQMNTMQLRKKNLSESSDMMYESDHKYALIHGPNFNNYDINQDFNNITHFTTPSQNRRSDHIQPRSDLNQKVKVNMVNSSFV